MCQMITTMKRKIRTSYDLYKTILLLPDNGRNSKSRNNYIYFLLAYNLWRSG